MLDDRTGDADRVNFLEGVLADVLGRNLPGDDNDRHRVHVRSRNAGYGIGSARA